MLGYVVRGSETGSQGKFVLGKGPDGSTRLFMMGLCHGVRFEACSPFLDCTAHHTKDILAAAATGMHTTSLAKWKSLR